MDHPTPPWAAPSHWVADTETTTGSRHPEVYQTFEPRQLTDCRPLSEATYECHSQNGLRLRISAHGPRLIRLRYSRTPFARDFSYALAEDAPPAASALAMEETDDELVMTTEALILRIAKSDLRLEITEREQSQVVLAEAAPYFERHSIQHGTDHCRVTFEAQPDEAYYGLGDKSWHLDLRGRHFQNWNTDSFGFHQDLDPLYRAIPFYYGLANQNAYGIFLHNTHRTHFDFDSQGDGCTRMWADGGELDYFFCHGPSLDEVAIAFHQLTGRPELPPLWALGFHQCRWSYYPEARVREVAREFRERQIPCDAIYLDIDHMQGYRCFTWDEAHFPDPAGLISELKEAGFETVVMIDPGIRVDESYAVYRDGMERDLFCRRAGGEHMVGPVWPPACVWPDYTREDVRRWWGELYEGLYRKDGVSGFWNDMNEPSVFKVNRMTFPDNVLHDFDGQPTDHRAAHNVYGQQMARATYEGLKRLKPSKRPFVLTRATFAGGQRHAAVWTGDNAASWEHLRLANLQCQRLSISGFSLVGSDIGGFIDQPTGELMVRWLQLGIFHPIFRVHSMGNNADGAAEADAEKVKAAEAANRLDQEPWVFGEPYTSQARRAIEFRYRLLPYLYTAVHQHCQDGLPVLRSLAFAAQNDPVARKRENEFLLGPQLLADPVTREGASRQRTYLPAGEWLNFHAGTHHRGRRYVTQSVNADSVPLYVRAGACIPLYPVQQFTGEMEIETITLRAYYTAAEGPASHLYLDAGEGYAYREGDYWLSTFRTLGDDRSFRITHEWTGDSEPTSTTFEVELYGFPFPVSEVLIDEVPIQIIDQGEQGAIIVAPLDFKSIEVRG